MAEKKDNTVTVVTPQGTKVTCDADLAKSLGWKAAGGSKSSGSGSSSKSSK